MQNKNPEESNLFHVSSCDTKLDRRGAHFWVTFYCNWRYSVVFCIGQANFFCVCGDCLTFLPTLRVSGIIQLRFQSVSLQFGFSWAVFPLCRKNIWHTKIRQLQMACDLKKSGLKLLPHDPWKMPNWMTSEAISPLKILIVLECLPIEEISKKGKIYEKTCWNFLCPAFEATTGDFLGQNWIDLR